ncbi:MAG: tape measure protein [Burkholderiaceae bacterium]
MATNNNRDVRLSLGVQVDGAEGVEKLAAELDALASEGTATAGAFDISGVAAGHLQETLAELTATTKAQRTAESAAQSDSKAARKTLDDQREALARLRIEYAATGGNADKYKTDVLQLRTAILDSRSALRQKQDALSNATTGARIAGGAEQRLTSDIKAAAAAIRSQAPAYRDAAQAAEAAAEQQIASQEELLDSVSTTGEQLQTIQEIATIALGGSYAGGLIASLGETADEFKNLSSRVKIATGDGELFDSAMEGIAEVSLRTHSTLQETATLFTRLSKAGQEAGLSAQAAQLQALSLTETINQAVQLSGASADASSAAVTQLIQGLQSGVLRGDEFNSVMEQAPRLADALAQGLGVATGELRNMAEQGQLTASAVIEALQGQSDVLTAEFQTLPLTIGRALQDLQTQWLLYVGAADNGRLSSQNAAKVISGLSENIDSLVTVLVAAGKVFAAFKITGIASGLLAWATNAGRATVATELQTVAQITNTTATATNTAAQITNAAAITRNAAARTVSAAAAAAGTAATLTGAAALGTMGAQAAATGAKVASAGIVMRAFTGLFSPWGVALLLLTPEIKRFGAAIGEGAAKLMGWGKVLEEAEAKTRAYEVAAKAQIEAQTRQNLLLKEARDKQFELTKAGTELVAKFDEMRTKGDSAADAIGKIGKDFDLANMPGIKEATAVLDKLLADGKLTADQFRAAWATALDGKDLAVFETQARAALTGTAREAERLAQIMDASLREAVKRTGIEFEVLKGGIGAVSRSALNDVDVIIQGLEKLKAEGVDVGRVLSIQLSKAINTADSEKALEDLRAKIESVRSKLGEKVADGLLDQAAQKSLALKNALDDAMPGIQSVREAMRQLGITSDETLKNTAIQSEKAYRTLTESGTGSTRELSEGFRKYAADAIAANKGIVSSAIQTEAAIRGLVVTTDSGGKVIIQTAAEAAKAVDKLGDAYRRSGDAAERAGDRAVTALERQNAATERANAATERAIELENKRQGLDKEGWSTNTNGGRVSMATSNTNPTKNFTSGQWVNLDENGQWQNLGRDTPVQKDGKWVAAGQDAAAGLSTGKTATTATSGGNTTHTVNLTLPGKRSASVNVASPADANALTSFLRQLESAAGAAS